MWEGVRRTKLARSALSHPHLRSVLPLSHSISQTLKWRTRAFGINTADTPPHRTTVQGAYTDMTPAREVMTCSRCRQSKRKCDKAKPSCTRCQRGGIQCIYDEDQQIDKSQIHTAHGGSEPEYPTPVMTPPTCVQKPRKRNRACLSCVRCHRLKIKCDQKEPCFRCSRSGVQCTYTHRPKLHSKQPPQPCEPASEEPQHQEVPFALTDDDPEFVVATWFLRKRGSTHYRAILNRVSTSSLHSTRLDIPTQSLEYFQTNTFRWNLWRVFMRHPSP